MFPFATSMEYKKNQLVHINRFPDLTQCGSDSCWIENGRGVPPEEQEGGSYEGQA